MKENWIKRERDEWNMVSLDRDDAAVEILRSTPKGYPEWEARRVVLVSVRTTWATGEDKGKQRISLTLREFGEKWSMRDLLVQTERIREIPAWLYDLITRATPRDIDVPEPLAYNGRKFGQ